jgi:hypothetical protein
VPISLGSIPHRHRPTPPNRSAKQVRQTGPPTDTAKLLRQAESATQRAPTPGDRLTRLVTYSSHRSVPISLGSNPYRHRPTPPTRSARTGPPTDTAKLLRQSESTNQRAPTAGEHLTRSVACRSSHRSVPISLGSNPYRHRRHRQRGPPEQVRQLTPPSCSARQRAPPRERQLPVTVSPDR